MKRLLKNCSTKWYHLTNNSNFNPSQSYNNNQQEFGSGLYITPEHDVKTWDNLLNREWAFPIDISQLNIINESDFPSKHKMVNDILDSGYTKKDVKNMQPSNTFNRDPMDIATKRLWAQINGYDAVKPFLDKQEGEQIVIFNLSKISIDDPLKTDEVRKNIKE
jgi:hypothetical protein